MGLKGGSKAKDGLYWKKGDWEIVTVEGENGALPGTEDLVCSYSRDPVPSRGVDPRARVLPLSPFDWYRHAAICRR